MSKHFRLDEELAPGMRVALDPHRFERVLRVRLGERLMVCDPRGQVFELEIVAVDPPAAEVLAQASAPDRNPRRELEVWVPLLKGGRTDDLVRQLTELGATRIVPFSSRHAVVRLDAVKARERQRRFAQIAGEAGNQCGRTALPEVLVPVEGLPREGPGIVLWEGGQGGPEVLPIALALADEAASGRVLVGPEGGLAVAEIEALAALGWRAATLGARILRAETAVLVLATLALEARGEWAPRSN